MRLLNISYGSTHFTKHNMVMTETESCCVKGCPEQAPVYSIQTKGKHFCNTCWKHSTQQRWEMEFPDMEWFDYWIKYCFEASDENRKDLLMYSPDYSRYFNPETLQWVNV